MRILLCGLGFHKWQHIGYDVSKYRFEKNEPWRIHYSSHRKCVSCEKRNISYTRAGVPPEVQISDDLTTFVDHSTPYMDPKKLLEKE